jgi:hypothetical protein
MPRHTLQEETSMRKYTFKLEVISGNDEFWEDIFRNYSTGCDGVVEFMQGVLWDAGLHEDEAILKLVKYECDDDG